MKNLIILLTLSATLWNCGSSSTSSFEKVEDKSAKADIQSEEPIKVVETDAVCLLDNLSVRKSPSDKGKWLTSISLGEVVKFTGEQTIDSVSKKTFYKIKLTGGEEGWTRSDFIEIDGKVGVFISDTEIYKRPDLLTKENRKYSQMDIIAVTNTQGDWAAIKGKRSEGKYIEDGWVKQDNISNKAIDIAVAKFGKAALAEEDTDKKIILLQEIIENNDLAESSFIPVLQSKLTDLAEQEKEILETIVDQATDSL